MQRADAYANRVETQIANIESGQEGERNVKYQKARQFMEPSGYFSAGLLAAGYDPQQIIHVTFSSYTGVGKPEVKTGSFDRPYYAWEIAAGALAHDKVQRGGPINFQSMTIEKKNKSLVSGLEALGRKLQDHWQRDIAKPMANDSGVLAQRSGSADAYVLRGTLQSLSNNKDSFENLSPEAKEAVKRTLEHNGQVIIPNIYGYPLAGYAFIPFTPYDGNYEHRPNQGLMIDLKNGAAHEIKGDKAFADWAKNNRYNLKNSFNASDRQGGMDAHWPKAGDILDTLIRGNNATYPGYQNFLKDQAIPVQETFNFTRARGEHYHLKFGKLDNIASKYQEQNAKNAVWADQTEVFGSSQQSWKTAKDFWSNTFGYVPIVGNAGNIVFGIHDGTYGKTAGDRVGGNAAAVISGLQLAHEIATSGVSGAAGEPPAGVNAPSLKNYSWRYNSPTSDFELVHASKASSTSDSIPVIKEGTTGISPAVKQPVTFAGMREIEFKGKTYFAADKPDAFDGEHYLLRVQDPDDPSKLASSGIIAKPDDAGVWQRRGLEGGAWWKFGRTPSPTPSEETKVPTKIANYFLEFNGSKMKGAELFDKYLNVEEIQYKYGIELSDNGEVLPQISWTTEENPADATSPPSDFVSTFGTSEYTEQFIKDLNRSKFTLEAPGGIKLEIDMAKQIKELGLEQGTVLSTGELDELKQQNIKAFEDAIPDPALRARISQVANQWALGAAPDEFRTSRFKGSVFGSGRDPHYYIKYDPESNTTTVTAKSDFIITQYDEINHDLEPLTDLKVKASRTVTIRESNELDSGGYSIDQSSPTRIEISPALD